ncbi:MAG TPA: bifunctional nuclease domain-containing protein [Streptosporangiaceae bacterium]|nr:bifunctional nuclease domain-containing protein [Streptosporangiaceae bacterium]
MSADVSDGDLTRLARGGDPLAFRLLVERHQAMVRARARQLGPDPGDVDDIVQESFLQAFLALDRLRDPDRFAGWLAGIVFNVCRRLHRRAPVTLLADWPEPLHPTSAGGLPSPEDLDRADALRTAVAGLPAGQRRAVTLHYYADVPAGQVAEAPGAGRASLHKARLRLRAYLTEHRPDLVPGRTQMTTVRVARIERRIPPGPVPDRFPTHVMVLADDAGRRDLPIWLLGRDSHRFADDARPGPSPDELTGRLLRAAGARVTAVDVDELGPEVTVARIELATPAGPEQVTARLLDGLAAAIISGAPIRVADAVMDRVAVPAGTGPAGTGPAGTGPAGTRPAGTGPGGTGQGGPTPEQTARDLRLDLRPRYEPRNLTFAAGLDHWVLGGSFTEHALQSHWDDYQAAADHGAAVLSAAVPRPEGFAYLVQEIFADDYRGTTVTFRGELRVTGGAGQAGLFVRVARPADLRGPATAAQALADPANHVVTVEGHDERAGYEVTAHVPEDANTVAFGVFLAGPGRIELRAAGLTTEN